MNKTVLQYQKAFNSIIEQLKSNKDIVAVMVFGSMVSGDLWDESDIDLFAITNTKKDNMENVYMEENEISIHIKFMSVTKFKKFYEKDLRGGFIHRIFSSSRLVFSTDIEVTNIYDNGRYYPDADRKRWNMVYLGNLIKKLGVCKKYLHNKRMYTAYAAAVNCTEDFSKLFLNSLGYMISNDAMIISMNLSESFKECVKNLFFNKTNTEECIKQTIEYIEDYIEENLKEITAFLLDYMAQKDKVLSSEEIKNDVLFKNFNIAMEDILNELWQNNLIKKECRDYKLENKKNLAKEKVYFI